MQDKFFNFKTFIPTANQTNLAAFSGQTNKYALYEEQSNQIHVFELSGEKPMIILNDFKQKVTSIALSRSENILIAGFDTGLVRVYDLSTGKTLRAYTAHRTAVTSLSITQNNSFFASGALDGQIKFWDLENHALLQDINPLSAMINGKKVSDSENSEVTQLHFNLQSTWLFIGDMSGRVLIWSLQKMMFLSEIIMGKKIFCLHAHQSDKTLFISSQSQFTVVELDSFQIIKQLPRQYFKIFTPLKNHLVVGVRSSGIDIFDLDSMEIAETIECTLKYPLCCGERKTSTVPQILVLQGYPTGQIQIDVCALKYSDSFREYVPSQKIQPQQKPREIKSAPRDQSKQAQYRPEKPQPQNDNQAKNTNNSIANSFVMHHKIRVKYLNDQLVMLKQVNNIDPIQSAIMLGDLNLLISVYSSINMSKIDLVAATKIIEFLNLQLQVINNLSMEQIAFIANACSRLTNSYMQMVNDTEFCFKNARRDIAVEERYKRTNEFKKAVIECKNTTDFLIKSSQGAGYVVKLQQLLLDLQKTQWK